MEYNKQIAAMRVGDEVEGFYLLKAAYPKVTAAGKPFLSATLADQSGTIELKVWDYTGPVGAGDEGSVIKIRGNVSEYRGALQLTAERIRKAEETDRYDLSSLVPTAPIDIESAMAELEALLSGLPDADYRAVAEAMLQKHYDAFRSIPAAKSVHHGFRGGLLMHTLNMLRIADHLASLYGDVVDRSLLLAGTLLHDFAKEQEFNFSPLGLVTDYSVRGELLGHLVMGAQEVCEVARQLNIPEEKSVLLQHLLLSHHGEPEFGAAVRPICAESELLSLIDMIDSRMEIYRETFAKLDVGKMSDRIFALDKHIYRHG